MSEGLPVIDIGPYAYSRREDLQIAARVRDALEHRGFMYLQGLGLAPGCLSAAFAAARRFFSSSAEAKQACAYTDADSNFGYQRVGAESLDPASAPDLKESFTMRNALAVGGASSRWPDAEFRNSALWLYREGLAAAYRVLSVIGCGLDLPPDYFTTRHRGTSVSLRFLHYPANLAPAQATQLGAGAHTDYGSITLLFQDAVGGLEVRSPDGEWVAAPYVPDTAVVNTGDLMERWTCGRFRSTLHRVRPMTASSDRYSIALFVDPDPEVVVEGIPSCVSSGSSMNYPPISAGEHIRQKIAATHGIPT